MTRYAAEAEDTVGGPGNLTEGSFRYSSVGLRALQPRVAGGG